MVAELKEPSVGREAARRPRRAPERRIAIWGPLLAVLALALLLVAGIWRQVQQRRAQREFSAQAGQVVVEIVNVKRDEKPHDLLLPGNINAMQEATLYARANGYVAKWLVDIGDQVKTGQQLAVIETPELDQQLAGGRSAAQESEANFEVARVTAQRWRALALFKNVTAPFDGTITKRAVDVGSLVSQGGGTAGTALFTLAQTDPLRIFIDVPQDDASLIETGVEVLKGLQEQTREVMNPTDDLTEGLEVEAEAQEKKRPDVATGSE